MDSGEIAKETGKSGSSQHTGCHFRGHPMAIEDVIRDLNTYFDSIKKPVQIVVHMGGIVNPSYLTVHRELEHTVFPFWSVAGGSSREKDLAKAFKDDIEAWLTKLETKPCQEVCDLSPSTTTKPVRKSKPVRSLTD